MNQVTLKSGTTIDVVQVNGQARYFQGTQRDTLEFHFPKDGNSFDNLEALFTEANTAKITITNDAGSFVYEDYNLRVSLALVPVVVMPAEGTAPEVTEERYIVTMAQKTYSEMQMDSLQETVDILVLESLGV